MKEATIIIITFCLSLIPVYADNIYTSNMLNYSNSVIVDTDCLGITNVSVYNNTWIDFIGKNTDNINLGTNTFDDLNKTGYTVSVWVKANKNESNDRLWSFEGRIGYVYMSGAFWKYFILDHEGNSKYCTASSPNAQISLDGTWQHVATTWNKTHAVMWINGVEECSVAVTGLDISQNRANHIGTNYGNGCCWLNGSVDDFKVYTYPLKQHHIQLLYNESSHKHNYGVRVPEIYYHELKVDQAYHVPVPNFQDQMRFLNDSGYNTITYKEYYNYTLGKFSLPKNPIIITFDDGAATAYTEAKPIMDNYSFYGVIAMISEYINDADKLNETMLREMITDGWEIASHSHSTTKLTDQTYTQRIFSFNYSKISLEGNLSPYIIRSFVFPSNSFNSTIRTEASVFYDILSGESRNIGGDGFAYFNYRDTYSVQDGVKRIYISNATTIDDFQNKLGWITNITHEYNLNEHSGSIAYDLSGNGNDGTISGSTWVNDTILQPLYRTYDYTGIGNAIVLNNTWYDRTYAYINYYNDSCGCPEIHRDWVMDRNCDISQSCDIGSGLISFTTNSLFTCTAPIYSAGWRTNNTNFSIIANAGCSILKAT